MTIIFCPKKFRKKTVPLELGKEDMLGMRSKEVDVSIKECKIFQRYIFPNKEPNQICNILKCADARLYFYYVTIIS